jgi:hypothetical protein
LNGQLCPECATPPAADGAPACGCAERAARAAQAGRTEEIAAAEDFDPLRIRPYVTLESGEAGAQAGAFRTAGPLPPLVRDNVSVAPPPAATDFYPERAPARRRPFKAVAVGAAVVAVIGTAAFASGLFSGHDQTAEAQPDDMHTDLPTSNVVEPDASLTSPAPSRSPFVSASPSAPVSSPVPDPSQQPAAVQAPPPSATAQPTKKTTAPPVQAPAADSSLHLGSTGAGVVDLQQRLTALWLYHGRTDGQYDQDVEHSVRIYQMYRHINGDPDGVYGPNTRRALESEPQKQDHNQTQGHKSFH